MSSDPQYIVPPVLVEEWHSIDFPIFGKVWNIIPEDMAKWCRIVRLNWNLERNHYLGHSWFNLLETTPINDIMTRNLIGARLVVIELQRRRILRRMARNG